MLLLVFIWVKSFLQAQMETQKNQTEIPPKPAMTSCRKKVKDDATFFEDVKDHIDEFIHASMDEHKTCFQKTISKVLSQLSYSLYWIFCLQDSHGFGVSGCVFSRNRS